LKAFADLYFSLDATTSNNAKLLAMQQYFLQASADDAAWAVYFLAGGKPRQLVPTKLLRQLTLQASALPDWLFEESYQAVGDLAETMTLLLPETSHSSNEGLATWVQDMLPLRGLPPETLLQQLAPLLNTLDRRSQLVCIKLITGSFRVGVSRLLVTRALAAVADVDAKRIAQRLVGYTDAATPAYRGALSAPGCASQCRRRRADGRPAIPFLFGAPATVNYRQS